MKNRTEQAIFEVVRPVGEATVKARQLAPRLDTLNGKTICEVYNGLFRGEKTFPKIRELLKKLYPGVSIVPYTELPTFDVLSSEEKSKELPGWLRQKGCDALISGNGG